MKRTAKAIWKGPGLEGAGELTTQSGVFKSQPYSAKLRFQNEDGKLGTNPEELIAAAHAGCFSMAFSFALSGAGFTADEISTDAALSLEKEGDGWTIKKIDLTMTAKIPGINSEQFNEIANGAKKGCPVSRVLSCEITLDAKLVS
jgi:osmotically inducible protein OsmC